LVATPGSDGVLLCVEARALIFAESMSPSLKESVEDETAWGAERSTGSILDDREVEFQLVAPGSDGDVPLVGRPCALANMSLSIVSTSAAANVTLAVTGGSDFITLQKASAPGSTGPLEERTRTLDNISLSIDAMLVVADASGLE
jgi:hypothetical protein